MLTSVLTLPLPWLVPKTKYVLVRFVQCFGSTGTQSLGLKEVAERLGLLNHLVSVALTELVARGVLACSSSSVGRGRPRKSYSLTKVYLSTLSSDSVSSRRVHVAAIERLLEGTKKESVWNDAEVLRPLSKLEYCASLRAKKRPEQLKDLNRFLLAVLLCHADDFGVVRDVGFATLRRSTGFSQVQLLYGIGRLIDHGLVRVYVAGTASSILVKKENSTYFLNLHHPEIFDGESETVVLVSEAEQLTKENMQQYGSRISEGAQGVRLFPSGFEGQLEGSFYYFFIGQRAYVYRLIELKLESYAAHLLSSSWRELASGADIENSSLRDLIRGDFSIPLDIHEPIDTASTVERLPSLVETMLYYFSINLAKRIQRMIRSVRDLPFESTDFVIIPQAADVGYQRFVLLARSRASSFHHRCLVLLVGSSDQAAIQAISAETEIPLEDQYRYGLRSRPSGRRPAD